MEGIAGETAIKLMHKEIGICISYMLPATKTGNFPILRLPPLCIVAYVGIGTSMFSTHQHDAI
jgi:hypothetical protein